MFSSLPSCIQANRMSLLLIHGRVCCVRLQQYVIPVMLAASCNNLCSSPSIMCEAAFTSCSTRLCIACWVLSMSQSCITQLQLAQTKLVTCFASKQSHRHWLGVGPLLLLVIADYNSSLEVKLYYNIGFSNGRGLAMHCHMVLTCFCKYIIRIVGVNNQQLWSFEILFYRALVVPNKYGFLACFFFNKITSLY
jgi:hypothetical protein